jgi:hypothetical protein
MLGDGALGLPRKSFGELGDERTPVGRQHPSPCLVS